MSYPQLVRSPSTRPSARKGGVVLLCPVSPRHPVQGSILLVARALFAPLTFSQTTSLGCMVVIASRIATQRLDRVPSVMPLRAPARLTSWHGEPPEIMSTVGMVPQSMVVMSPRLGVLGKCLLRMRVGASSISLTHWVVAPSARSTASASPPYPAKSSPLVRGVFTVYIPLM